VEGSKNPTVGKEAILWGPVVEKRLGQQAWKRAKQKDQKGVEMNHTSSNYLKKNRVLKALLMQRSSYQSGKKTKRGRDKGRGKKIITFQFI